MKIVYSIIMGLVITFYSYAQYTPIISLACDECDYLIEKIAISSSGKYIATGGDVPKVWDSNTSEIIREFDIFTDPNAATCLRFSNDESLLLIGYFPFTANLYRIEDGKLLHTFETLTMTLDDDFKFISGVNACDFNSDNSLIVLSDFNGAVQVFNLDNYEEVARLQFPGFIDGVRFTKLENKVHVYDTSVTHLEWDFVNEKVENMGLYSRLAFSDDSNWMLVQDGFMLYVKNLITGMTKLIDSVDRIPYINSFDVTGDGKHIILSSYISKDGDKAFPRQVFDVNSKSKAREYSISTESEKDSYQSNDTIVKFFPDGKRFLSVNNKTVHIYDISDLTSSVSDAKSLE